MATVPHVTAWAGRTKYQADGFLFDWVYSWQWAAQQNTQNALLRLHCNKICTTAPQRHVIWALPTLLHWPMSEPHTAYSDLHFTLRKWSNSKSSRKEASISSRLQTMGWRIKAQKLLAKDCRKERCLLPTVLYKCGCTHTLHCVCVCVCVRACGLVCSTILHFHEYRKRNQ